MTVCTAQFLEQQPVENTRGAVTAGWLDSKNTGISGEPPKKNPAGYFPYESSWLVDRDPYFMVYEIIPT